MEKSFKTLLNLRDLIKETIYSTEQDAKKSTDFIEVKVVEQLLSQIRSDLLTSEKKLSDYQIELIDRNSINMKAKEAEEIAKSKIREWIST